MEKPDCIVLEKINHRFDDKRVLTDINLTVPYGGIFGLLGPSGCGKTTTVKIMAGILEATSGSVTVLGESMPKLQVMNRIGYMAQSDALYPLLTAGENLAFFAALYGMKKTLARERIREVMALVNLTEDLSKAVMAYSGGMKRRLSLAMALLHEPEVLILDEPTVGIDPVLRKSIWEALYVLAEKGMTIIVTTHVMDEAEKCHHLAMIRDGRLIAEGTPLELQHNSGAASLEEAFICYGKADGRADGSGGEHAH
ncbi:MAG: ABC transporter ATP-binding protein [Treponema sp.]|nr:ABC transporter ATP-binding protein [Treponema sp.]